MFFSEPVMRPISLNVGFLRPGFRDGNLSHAVDTVSNNGTLYFTSAGNDATAGRFTSVSRPGWNTGIGTIYSSRIHRARIGVKIRATPKTDNTIGS